MYFLLFTLFGSALSGTLFGLNLVPLSLPNILLWLAIVFCFLGAGYEMRKDIEAAKKQ